MAGDQNTFLSFNAALTYNAGPGCPGVLAEINRIFAWGSSISLGYKPHTHWWSRFLQPAPQFPLFNLATRLLACAVAFCFCGGLPAQGQGDSSQPSQGLPFLNTGADSVMSQIDMVEM